MTAEEILNTLPPEIVVRILRNTVSVGWEYESDEHSRNVLTESSYTYAGHLIDDAFWWDVSPEGEEFWGDYIETLRS